MALATVSLSVFLVMVLAVTTSSGLSDVFSNGSHTCNNHSQCALNEMCVDNTCMDPCTFVVCQENATCRARNHKAICVTVVGECKTDNDCKEEESCDETEQKCVDPCVGRCGKNTICTVKQHIPNCECEPGYVGEPFIECVWPECYTHYDCAENRTCISSMCVDPCTGRCGSNTDCEVHRLMPHCSCKPGYMGNPLVKCDKPECITNDNCPTNSSCVSYKCVDPCHGRCGSNTECLVHRHVPDCSCKPGYIGNPLDKCDPPECMSNDNCPTNSSCVSYKCVDPCHGRCGSNTECHVHRHVPDCSCKPGYTGNPLVNCTNRIGEKRYTIPWEYKADWFTAISRCNSKGMRLASVLNQEENNQMRSVIEEELRRRGKFDIGGVYWIAGLNTGGSWRWMTTGDTINYTDWHPGGGGYVKEPKSGEGYLFLTAGFKNSEPTIRYGWHAQDKNFKTLCVCEYFI